MEKLKRNLLIIMIFTITIYSVLGLLNINSFAVSQSISININSLNDNKYPGIKEKINNLKSKYPNWNFKILYTDLDWNDVILNEYVGHNSGPRNMIQAVGNYQGAWICSLCKYQNGSWRCASQDAIKYIMDPRNSLNETDIFQFEELTNNTASKDAIKKIVEGTFLQGHATEILNSANNTGINAYYIVARLLQEQSSKGSVLSDGSKGYFNPFNIQANGNTDQEVINNGINYAKSQGWNTLEKGITGGINFLSKEYIKKGQNTLYLQKFDVESSANGLYWHQYMQNLLASQSEGRTLRNTYKDINAINSSHTFVIPVYKNMPSKACAKPNESTSSSLSGDIVKINVTNSLNLRNAPNGTVIGYLYKDEIVTRIEKASSRNGKTFWDKVRKSDGTEGYVARETDIDEGKYKLYLVPVKEENNTDSSNNNISVKKGDVNGDGKITSSDYVLIKNHIMGTSTLTGIAIDMADYNGDGKITSSDYVLVKNYIMSN